jgi:hypothetical protein
MTNIELLSINSDSICAEEMVEIVERAYKMFPCRLWDGVEVLGKAEIKHDANFKVGGREYPAHMHIGLIQKLNRMKEALRICNPLMGVSHDPIVVPYSTVTPAGIAIYYQNIVDFAYNGTAAFTFFGVSPKKPVDFVTHTLGHLGGLGHHEKPIDVMYFNLPEKPGLNNFCRKCKRKLKEYSERSV